MQTREGDPICFERAKGASLFDAEGNRYVDYLNGWGPIILGHCDEDVNATVSNAVEKRDLVGMSTSQLEVEAAELVKKHVPCAELVQFGTTGSEVVTHAIRAARAYTGRSKIIKFQGHYHGWYDPIAMNYLSRPENMGTRDVISTGIPESAVEDTIVLPFNDLDEIADTVDEYEDEVASIILEPVAHDMGCVPPREGYLQGLRDICDEHGIVLIFDEIITGFRHGMGGVQAREGVTPDLTTMAKAVANGYPASLLCGREEFMNQFTTGERGGGVYFAGTYNAHTASMAAVVETIRQLEARDVHATFDRHREQLVAGIEDHIEDIGLTARVHAYGGIFATYFSDEPIHRYRDLLDHDREQFQQYRWEMVDRGVLMVPKFPRANLLNASLTDGDVDTTIEAVGESLAAVA
ncbi:aspartate aminotransferase family protein [Natrialbaceae archaeon A-CW1-1]